MGLPFVKVRVVNVHNLAGHEPGEVVLVDPENGLEHLRDLLCVLVPHGGTPVDPGRCIQVDVVKVVVGVAEGRDLTLLLLSRAVLFGVRTAIGRRALLHVFKVLLLEVEPARVFAVVATAVEHQRLVQHEGVVVGGGEHLTGGGQSLAAREPYVDRQPPRRDQPQQPGIGVVVGDPVEAAGVGRALIEDVARDVARVDAGVGLPVHAQLGEDDDGEGRGEAEREGEALALDSVLAGELGEGVARPRATSLSTNIIEGTVELKGLHILRTV